MRSLDLFKIVLSFLLITSLLGPLLIHERKLITEDKPGVLCTASNSRTWIIQSDSPKLAGEKCLSRRDWSNWKTLAGAHELSPALKSALARYEKLHASCYNGRDLEQALMDPSPRDSCRYLVHSEVDGLGNRVLTLASAFTFALLTNRVLLIESKGHLSKLLCEPFAGTSWVLPEDFPYNLLDQAPTLRNARLENNPPVVRVRLMNVQSRKDQKFFSRRTRSNLQQVKWLVWSSNLYYIPRLFTLPEFWEPLVFWFPEVSLAFTQLSKYLVLPSNRVWDKIHRLRSSYLSSPGKLLGVQVRLHHRGDPGAFHWPTNKRIFQCLVENKLLPALLGNTTESEFEDRREAGSIKVLVTSLQAQYYEELKRAYMDRASEDGSLVQVHTLSHDGVQSESLEQAMNAMVEMWLLSFSDELVTSSCSTFGYVAQGIGGVRPRILNIQGDDVDNCGLEACSLGQSVDPCNHYPFFMEWEKREVSLEHQRWMRVHVRGCQDEIEGIQLV